MADIVVRVIYLIAGLITIYFIFLAIRKLKASDVVPTEIKTTIENQAEIIKALTERNVLLEKFQQARESLPTTVNVTSSWKFEVWLVDKILPSIDVWRAAKLVSLVNDEPVYTLEARIVNLGRWTIRGITGHTIFFVENDSYVLCSISERYPDRLIQHGVYPRTTNISSVGLTMERAYWAKLDYASQDLMEAFFGQLPTIFKITEGSQSKAYQLDFENDTMSFVEIPEAMATPYMGLHELWGSITREGSGKYLIEARHIDTIGARYTPTERTEWTVVRENDHWNDPYRLHLVETRHTRDNFTITALLKDSCELSAVFSEYTRCYMAVNNDHGQYMDERLPEAITFDASRMHGFWCAPRYAKDDSVSFYCEQEDSVIIVINGEPQHFYGYQVHNTINEYGRGALALVLVKSSDQTVLVYDLAKQKILMKPTRGVHLESISIKDGKVNLAMSN